MATSTAGYSGTPLPKKLGIREGTQVALLHAPDGFETLLLPLPPGARVERGLAKTARPDLVVGFVSQRDHLARNITWLLDTLTPNGVLWVAWPKKASKVETDMSDQVIREVILPLGWVDTKVCAIDATWSGLKLVLRKELRKS